MKDKIEMLLNEIKEYKAANKEEIEAFRLKFLSKKGVIQGLFANFRNVPNEEKRQMGKLLNDLKTEAQERFNGLKDQISEKDADDSGKIDLSLPVDFRQGGSRHPLSITANEIVRIFDGMGFGVAEGPEIEDDWHNFSALNFPEDHPARDMQDTFFIEEKPSVSLRTHTSSVQIRYMENNRPPLRAIFPGRVFRNEAISARAHCIFHQVEGLYVDKDVSFADLKLTLLTFARDMFGPDTGIRLRPSYFPFTEPSAEMDISCMICKGKGCNICKYTGWVEILGCGMVDPNVLKNCNIDPDEYSGFAFGMGVERITMLKYQVKDIRLFFENDLRFLEQFKSSF